MTQYQAPAGAPPVQPAPGAQQGGDPAPAGGRTPGLLQALLLPGPQEQADRMRLELASCLVAAGQPEKAAEVAWDSPPPRWLPRCLWGSPSTPGCSSGGTRRATGAHCTVTQILGDKR